MDSDAALAVLEPVESVNGVKFAAEAARSAAGRMGACAPALLVLRSYDSNFVKTSRRFSVFRSSRATLHTRGVIASSGSAILSYAYTVQVSTGTESIIGGST